MAPPKCTQVLRRQTYTVKVDVKRTVIWNISRDRKGNETRTPWAMVFYPPTGKSYTRRFMRMVARRDGYPKIPCWNATTGPQ